MLLNARYFGRIKKILTICASGLALLPCSSVLAQEHTSLHEAVETAVKNYGSIKAKQAYAEASKATVKQSRYDYLPNLVLSGQQSYGTINGQNGPGYGFGGYGVASSGLPLPNQNWNAAFGALYLANVNWEFFAFGRAKEKIRIAKANALRDESDHAQELFQHQVKVAAAYLNLLAAQSITHSQQNNFARADTFRVVVTARAKNGLVPGVDSSLANAEVANAKIEWIKAMDAEEELSNRLAFLMGVPAQNFVLDSLFVSGIPVVEPEINTVSNHPLLQFYKNRVIVSERQTRYLNSFKYPSFSLFSVFQSRGSGFGSNYATNQSDFNHDYVTGIKPVRSNYLVGVGVTWNLTSILRTNQQVTAQNWITRGLQEEYDLTAAEITNQLATADNKMKNALHSYTEVPALIKAATDGFTQKTVLYKNGLADIVEVTQSLFTLNRAETNRDIIYNNVWQALLLKAAASGDFNIFGNQVK